MVRQNSLLASALLVSLLSACGGGGGGGSSAAVRPDPATEASTGTSTGSSNGTSTGTGTGSGTDTGTATGIVYQSLVTGSTSFQASGVISGVVVGGSVDAASNDGGNVTVNFAPTTVTTTAIGTGTGTGTDTGTGTGNDTYSLHSLPINTDVTISVQSASGVSFTETFKASDLIAGNWHGPLPGDMQVTLLGGFKDAEDGSARLVEFIKPDANFFQYSTLGWWDYLSTTGDETHGYFVAGDPTRPSDIPTTGTASYSGLMLGHYASADGLYAVNAKASAQADFAAQTVALQTSGTVKGTFGDVSSFVADSGLNLTGTLSINRTDNKLTGQLATTNGLSGGAVGKFFGPAAKEMGGTFLLQNNQGTEQMVGGFLLKR